MKRRLITALLTGVIGVVGGVAVANWTHQQSNMFGIVLVCGLVGFFFGLVFKLEA